MKIKCKKQFYFKQFTLAWVHCLNVKQLYFIDRTLSGAITPGQRGPGSDGSEGVLHIPQITSITGASPSDCFVSCPVHSLRESYPSA